jgi:hypothetical protein
MKQSFPVKKSTKSKNTLGADLPHRENKTGKKGREPKSTGAPNHECYLHSMQDLRPI